MNDVQHYFGDDCPDDSAEHWRDQANGLGREVTRLRDQISVMSRERHQWEQDIRAAARRQAWDSALYNTELHLKRAVSSELYGLAYRLEHLPEDKLRAKDLLFVRDAARRVRLDVSAFKVEEPGRPLVEVRRLREAIYEQGRRLHAEYGVSTGERCGCPGCEMTRAIELHEVTEEPTEVAT